jgi:hypothetical protein
MLIVHGAALLQRVHYCVDSGCISELPMILEVTMLNRHFGVDCVG